MDAGAGLTVAFVREDGGLLTVAFFGSGGAGTMVPLDAVAKRHRIVAVIRPAPSKSWIRWVARAALSRFGVGTRSAMANWARQKRVPLLNAFSGRDADLASRLKEFAPDVILSSWAHPDGWAATRLGREFELPVLIKVIGTDILVNARNERRRDRIAEALTAADAVAAVSRDLAQKVAELGVDPARIHVVH